ncbi:aminotransferase class III-fold pyridoxal phosphate-dependent enzyme [Amycolatopsis sp. NPDC051102]|uniref:aminotransferase class III-fold pyridoxal phosphate-dependent enzyme n=1 Tax=Amycolatopsis sp. NPDC051102 TaxID=3155163 RepID=UPI0034257F44
MWYPWSPNEAASARITADRASGYQLWDISGKEFIDASSMNLTCGYGHPEVVAAATEQMTKLHSVDISQMNHTLVGALAERLAGFLPDGLSRTFFTNSGSEGLEASLFIASCYWAHTSEPRSRVVTFARGYHGSTVLARSLSGLPPTAHGMNQPFPVTRIDLPVSDREARLPESVPAILARFDEAIGDRADDLPIAVVAEPFLNVGGGVVLAPGLLRGLRTLCDERRVLLILDEVFTGVGRTGRMFGFDHDGITPDIVITSKGLSGGYAPITAVTAQEQIYATFVDDPIMGGIRYGHTTSGHAVACAVASAVLDVVRRDDLTANAQARGAQLVDLLQQIAGAPEVVDVRGTGLAAAVQMSTTEAAEALVKRASEHGLLVHNQGPAVLVVPPLVVDEEGVDAIGARLAAATQGGSC